MTDADILRQTLAALRENGWIKNYLCASNGVCINGAVNIATTGNAMRFISNGAGELKGVREIIYKIVKEQFPERAAKVHWRRMSPHEFNNHPDTTFEDMEMVLEKAILIAEDIEAGISGV